MMKAAPAQRWLVVFLFTALCALLLVDPAFAQATGSVGQFSCQAGKAVGSFYNPGASCPTTLSFTNVFSFVVCNMEQLSSDVLGSMYCGMMHALLPGIQAVLVMSVMFFGMAFTIGVVPMAAREFQRYLIKIAIIYAFMTQADLLIGLGYRLLVVGMRDAVSIALSTINLNSAGTAITSGADVFKQFDSFLSTALSFATASVGIDANNKDVCKNAIFAVIALMAVAFPPMAYISLLILFKIALTFLRAVFGYIYALVGIAFLMTLAPFFLSFYLFTATRPLFDRWIGYMAGYALQIVILFAFLGFILSINVSSITTSFTGLAMRSDKAIESGNFRMPLSYCTICEFEVVDKDSGQPISDNSKDFISRGKMQCKLTNGEKKSYDISNTTAPPAKASGQSNGSQETVKRLFKFTSAGLLSLLVLAYIIDTLLRTASQFAQQIAGNATGARYATQLGGGFSQGTPTVDIPGLREDARRDPERQGILTNFGDRFDQSFQRSDKNAISRTGDALKEATTGLVGTKATNGQVGTKGDIYTTFTRWLADPNKMGDN